MNGNGYKPFIEIYRYIGLKAVERSENSKPVVLVKGRQVGATTMAAALECYFMASGLFGNNNRPAMRMMHLFPTLALAVAYTKDKFDPMITSSKPIPGELRQNGTLRSLMETKLDRSSPANNNMHYKKFLGGNQVWIESTGADGDRIRGRQLALDTELPTPNGWVQLKDLKEGDQLFDESGKVCNVTKLHPIQESPESYKITFDDGTVVEACAEHLWATQTRQERRKKRPSQVRNTKEILNTLKACGESNHTVALCDPVEYSEKELLIDPYLLGLWLGDGSRYGQIETADPEILYEFEHRIIESSAHSYGSFSVNESKSSSYRVLGLTTKLKKIGLIDNSGKSRGSQGDLGFYKKIPENYMRSCFKQRLALLQGLMDSDGCCYSDKRCDFTQCEAREELAFQVLELIQSLGIKARITKKPSYRYNVRYQDKYVITFCTTLPVFRVKRKLNKLPTKLVKAKNRFIKSIEPIPSKPMRCITVDSPSHLYLITRSFIPTHNTVDAAFFDECFPYDQQIETENGKYSIGKLYKMFVEGKPLPRVKTYNENSDRFELKKITNAWKRDKRELVEFKCGSRKIKCTPNHRFLTNKGWAKVEEFKPETKIKTYNYNNGFISVRHIKTLSEKKYVYDIEVEDNHNFIVTSGRNAKGSGGLIAHNCQDIPGLAIGAANKVLTKAQYGAIGDGIQVYFGTPKQKGTAYYNMWKKSTQQYYHLGCENCEEYFPLYHPNVNWEDIWIYGFVVRCPKCKHEQDKNDAAERGKWIPYGDELDSDYIGYHINQLYIPDFPKEKIIKAKPENTPTNTERIYQNEVLGEFYDGEGATLSPEEIHAHHEGSNDSKRRFTKNIGTNDGSRVYAGFDWGQRGDWDQLSGRQRGQSYSCGVILTALDPSTFQIEFATRLKKTDPQSKMDVVEEMFRRYSVHMAIGDIGDASDLTHILQKKYNDRFLASRAAPKVIGHIKYTKDIYPKEIVFEKDYYISELMGLLKKGAIRFPYGNYDEVKWLIDHCCSMEIRITHDRSGDPVRRYVKGATPNDGLMALLNAYLAYKFDITQGFSIRTPQFMKYDEAKRKRRIPAVTGYMPRWK